MNHKPGLCPEIPHWRGLRLHEISQCLTSSISNFDWPNVSSFSKLEDLDVPNENYQKIEVHNFISNIDSG